MFFLRLAIVIVTTRCIQSQCPPLHFPSSVQPGCHVIVVLRGGCREMKTVCRRVNRCSRPHEMFFACASDCESTCAQPFPICSSRCFTPRCQCAPTFFRDAYGSCVVPNQCGRREFQCVVHRHCQYGETCIYQRCTRPDKPNKRCYYDSECYGQQTCVLNVCIDASSSTGECSLNRDCERHESCISGKCVHQGIERICDRNSQCPRKQTCVHGKCSSRGYKCDMNRDCLRYQTCVRGQCVHKDSGTCDMDRDCKRGEKCSRYGRCKSRESDYCDRNRDCQSEQRCIDGRCRRVYYSQRTGGSRQRLQGRRRTFVLDNPNGSIEMKCGNCDSDSETCRGEDCVDVGYVEETVAAVPGADIGTGTGAGQGDDSVMLVEGDNKDKSKQLCGSSYCSNNEQCILNQCIRT